MTAKLKRLLGTVLAMAMLATMLVLPAGALAAKGYAALPIEDNSGAQTRNVERVIGSLSGYKGSYVESGDEAVAVDWKSEYDFSFTNRTGKNLTIYLWIDDDELRASVEESDTILGYGTTSIYGTSSKRSNIKLAAKAVDGTQLAHNDVFSFNDIVGPRTSSKGYKSAVNGRGVKVTGGGVAQVASAIWLAIEDMDDIQIIDKHTYGKRYSETYVDDADDAIVTDYSAGTDFSFRYKGDDVITINCYVQNDTLVCEISTEDAVG